MSQHTPGPWYMWQAEGICGVGKGHSNGADILRVTQESNRPGSEDIANMKLIAAAPDLREALDKMLDHFEGNIPLWLFELAEGAIAKARGDQ